MKKTKQCFNKCLEHIPSNRKIKRKYSVKIIKNSVTTQIINSLIMLAEAADGKHIEDLTPMSLALICDRKAGGSHYRFLKNAEECGYATKHIIKNKTYYFIHNKSLLYCWAKTKDFNSIFHWTIQHYKLYGRTGERARALGMTRDEYIMNCTTTIKSEHSL